MPINAISAPYNFVPLADWVHCPLWAEQVSHDLPFRDGQSGHLDLTITAHTPILVGGEQTKATADAPGEVHPYRLPDGRYAIPGSSLKGMIRSVVEIASFSRMGMVDDVRFGLRDISGRNVSAAYTNRVRNRVQTGFMQVGDDGLPRIIPCSMVRLSHRELEGWLDKRSPIFKAERSVSKKYRRWRTVCDDKKIDPERLQFSQSDGDATRLGEGPIAGVPVFTGQISDSTKSRGKSRDFVFFDEREEDAFAPCREDWSDFLYVHGDQATKDAGNMSWPGYWKGHYWNGERIPVFYIRDTAKVRIGLAYMPRLAGDFSVGEMIAHSSPDHLKGNGRGRWDFAETLFGTVSQQTESCLKGRVIFQHATANGQPAEMEIEPTILNGPKGSYFPNYILQDADPTRWKIRGTGYATAIQTQEHPKPEVRGWKRYPARLQWEPQKPSDEQLSKKKIQVHLHPLHSGTTGTTFATRIGFHNLRQEELGALCWALTWGRSEDMRHGLGMGKSFGLGQVSIDIDNVDLQSNQPDAAIPRWEQCCDIFISHMETVCNKRGMAWQTSKQIQTLLAMADPQQERSFQGKLRHMRLEPKKKINEFVMAKQEGLVLADYPRRDHPPTWEEQRATERAEAELIAAEQAEIERLASEAAKRAREQAEFDALPASRKLIITTHRSFEDYVALSQPAQKRERADFIGGLNALSDSARAWPDADERCAAGNLLADIYEAIDWADPGQNRKRRGKQEQKRKRIVDGLREDCSASGRHPLS